MTRHRGKSLISPDGAVEHPRDLGDRTRLTHTMRFTTTEERDTTMQYGVEDGAKSGFARMDELLQRLPLDA